MFSGNVQPLTSSTTQLRQKQENVNPKCLGHRKSLLGDHVISLYHCQQKGMRASVTVFNRLALVTAKDLPVKGISKELIGQGSEKLAKFLANTYWLPIKDSNGQCEAVCVRPALKGGSPMPVIEGKGAVSSENGSSYNDTKFMMRQHLEIIVNPHLLEKVKNLLRAFVDGAHGLPLKGQFPKDTLQCLNAFNAKLIDHYKRSGSSVDVLREINKDLADLIALPPRQMVCWPELDFFFQLPEVMNLENSMLEEILKTIELKPSSFLAVATNFLKQANEGFKPDEAFDTRLKKGWKARNPDCSVDYDWPTLGSQIVNIRHKEESFKQMLAKGADHFKGKQLYIQESVYSGAIKEAIKEEDNSLLFTLDVSADGDNVQVRICPDCTIQIIKNSEYGLLEALQNAWVFSGDLFKLYDRNKNVFLNNSSKMQCKGEAATARTTGFFNINKIITYRLDDQAGTPQYLLTVSRNKHLAIQSIELKDIPNNRVIVATQSEEEFNARMRLTCQKNARKEEEITSANIDQKMQIREPRYDEAQNQRNARLDVERNLEELRQWLIEDVVLLQELIESFIQTKLVTVNLDLLKKQNRIKEKLKLISSIYYNQLNENRREEEVLRQVVEEANYVKFVEKDKAIFVLKLMELLSKSEEHRLQIENKDVVIFMGNTGAGKSTVVCDLLGAKLASDINGIGQSILRHPREDSRFPRIGQSLGTSETLYAQGFPHPGFPIAPDHPGVPAMLLVDLPGLQETRGLAFELCTHLSVDRAVLSANSIRAIVLVVPMGTFLSDRASPLIRLFKEIEERFPDIFQKGSSVRDRLHIIVTKDAHHEGEVVNNMKNGHIPNAFLKEINDEITRQEANLGLGPDRELFLSGYRFQQNVWKLLVEMHVARRLVVAQIGNNVLKRNLLSAYWGSCDAGIDTSHYEPAMQNGNSQKKFADNITLYASTWRKELLERYENLPHLIEKCGSQVEEEKRKIIDKEAEWEKKLVLLKSREDEQKKLIELLKRTDDASEEARLLRIQALQQELQARHKELSTLGKIVWDITSRITKTSEIINTINANIARLIDERERISTQIRELSEGSQTIVLESYDGDTERNRMSLVSLRQEAIARAFKELSKTTSNDGYNQREVNKRDYRGTLLHEALIDREFRLLPNDPTIRDAFKESVEETFSQTGNVIATVTGRKVFSIKRNTSDEGKKVLYHIRTLWDGEPPFPQWEIKHHIANTVYHEAQIANLKNELITCEAALSQAYADRDEKLIGLEIHREDDKKARDNIRQHREETGHLKQRQRELMTKEQLLVDTKTELEKTLNEKTKIELDYKFWTKNNKPKTEEIIYNKTKELHGLQLQKRHLAVVIHTRIGDAQLLMKFAHMVTSGQSNGGAKKSKISLESKTVSRNVFEECRQFLAYCTENRIAKILQQCKRELNIK